MFLKPDERGQKIIRTALRFEIEFANLLSEGVDLCYHLKIEYINLAKCKLVYIASLSEQNLLNISDSESRIRCLNECINSVTLERIKRKNESEKFMSILNRMSVFFPEYIETVRAEIINELVVPPARIEPATSSLPMKCTTTVQWRQ
jgi:hypothetical protein